MTYTLSEEEYTALRVGADAARKCVVQRLSELLSAEIRVVGQGDTIPVWVIRGALDKLTKEFS